MFKKRIGITQKVMKHPHYNEVLDCLDQRWAELLISLGFLPVPLPNIPPSNVQIQLAMLQLDGVILSGGNTLVAFADDTDKPDSLSVQRDTYEMSLLNQLVNTSIPVLGVCRGLQLINVFYGGGLVKVKGHAGQGNHTLTASENNLGFDCPSSVNSYHNCGVPHDQLGNGLIPLAYDSDGFVEAFRHSHDDVLAIMWHPEREIPFLESDCTIIKKVFDK